MKHYELQGLDEFQPLFFQKYWDIVEQYIHKLVNQAFEKYDFDNEINNTLLALIPKVEQLEDIKQFTLIFLCNIIYMIIAKVLVNQMKPILGKLIHLSQASFIPGRQATNNIIITQELIDSITNFKAKNGGLMLKLDLEMAHNKVDWDFFYPNVAFIQLPQTIINLIHKCINFVKIVVLWNREKIEFFKLSRGLRQETLFLLFYQFLP